MATFIFNSAIRDALVGNINFAADTFRMMLVTSAYTPDKDTHTKRSQVTNELAASGGYVAGGEIVGVTVNAVDTAADQIELVFATTDWDPATFTTAAAVIYKARGGAATADELVAYLDFGGNRSPNNGPFVVSFSTPLIFQN